MNDQGIRCPYCLEIFLNHKALSFHFVKYHFFIKKKQCVLFVMKFMEIY
jgi:uncharacterized C2H2 Zn-finger protein